MTSTRLTDSAEDMRLALQLTAGALAALRFHEDRVIRFRGQWAHLGDHTIGEILDRADAALSRLTPPSGRADPSSAGA